MISENTMDEMMELKKKPAPKLTGRVMATIQFLQLADKHTGGGKWTKDTVTKAVTKQLMSLTSAEMAALNYYYEHGTFATLP